MSGDRAARKRGLKLSCAIECRSQLARASIWGRSSHEPHGMSQNHVILAMLMRREERRLKRAPQALSVVHACVLSRKGLSKAPRKG
jgi:hypothetical protein